MINRFPTDRVNNFSDAIYAIAITLLILEVKPPSSNEVQNLGLLGTFNKLIPSFISLFISFFVTALYWRAHLQNAQIIKHYDSKLLWLNIWHLLFVVMLPFSTALYAKNFAYNSAFTVYAINVALIGLFNYWMVSYAIKREGATDTLTPVGARWFVARTLPAPIIWLLSALLAPILPLTARFLFIAIFIVLFIGGRRNNKALAKEAAAAKKNAEIAAQQSN